MLCQWVSVLHILYMKHEVALLHNVSECCLLLPENVAGVGVVLQLRQVPVSVLQLQVHTEALQEADQLVITSASKSSIRILSEGL